MDPNEALNDLRAAVHHWNHSDSAEDASVAGNELAEVAEALDEWLAKGGFLPDGWTTRPTVDFYTITVAGPERHDGEAPYVYVLPAVSLDSAVAEALLFHCEQEEIDDDVQLVESESGWPEYNCGYAFNVLARDEHGKLHHTED